MDKKTKKVLITQSNYIPWKGYFDAINMADVFVVYDDMQYTKRDWRNRNQIKTAQGLLWLTVPVAVKGKFEQKIFETEIGEPNWAKKHWKTIESAYSKAPFFKQFKPVFEDLYCKAEDEKMLSNVNLLFIRSISNILGIDTEFKLSSDFELKGDKTEKLLNICLNLEATHYITGPAAKNYMDTKLFENAGIEIVWMDYSNYPEYTQLYEDFSHNVSILDLIFNSGPNAMQLMKSFKKYDN
jgi:hypothetical protein